VKAHFAEASAIAPGVGHCPGATEANGFAAAVFADAGLSGPKDGFAVSAAARTALKSESSTLNCSVAAEGLSSRKELISCRIV
jgi:hypothetical protein